MKGGFFPLSDLMVERRSPSLIPRCGQCQLYRHCDSPKMPVDGKGKKGVLIVGESPGKNEDIKGIPFCGKSGNLLQDNLARLGVDMRRDCWLTNSLICRPENNKIPNDRMVDWCRPNLLRTIKELQPRVIILLGKHAVKSLIGHVWREDVGPIGRWVGWKIPCREPNAWVCPTWHPAFILRENESSKGGVAELLFRRHLEVALESRGRPWEEIPDERSEVQVVMDDREASGIITGMATSGKPIAFDYETDRLKPDHPETRIVSCAVSDGTLTVSFPWRGQVVETMGRFLKSTTPKIASNVKFEDRWTRRIFGHGVRNWLWDTMLAAHVLDNRTGITSIKFQSFVLLGHPCYDGSIKPFLASRGGGNDVNRITEVGLDKLLCYGGLDALLEWKVAQIQMKQLGAYNG